MGRGLLNKYVQLAVGAVLVTASELMLKYGSGGGTPSDGVAGLSVLGSAWVWGGIACYVASFVSWLYVLRHIPLVVAFNLMNSVHVLVPVGAWALLRERVSPMCWGGIAVVVAGLVVIAKPAARLEARL